MRKLLLLCLSLLVFFVLNSCNKEYSCENCQPLGWEFVANGKKHKGSIVVNAIRYDSCGISFHGPEEGVNDYILSFGVEFSPVKLNSNLSNVAGDTVGFMYEHATPIGPIKTFASGLSCCPNDIKVTIDNFDNRTKIIVGSFSGKAYEVNGNIVFITEGKFRAHL